MYIVIIVLKSINYYLPGIYNIPHLLIFLEIIFFSKCILFMIIMKEIFCNLANIV